MSETETGGAPEHSKGQDRIAEIERRLKAEGVEIDNESVQKAILITTEALIEAKERELREVREKMEGGGRVASTRALKDFLDRPGMVLLLMIGLGAMISALVTNFDKFQAGIRGLLRSFPFGISDVVISKAYAEVGSASTALPSVLPIVVYLIYLLFSIGYVASLYFMFKGTTAKDRANAMEILKNLTAFFIGAISGKVA